MFTREMIGDRYLLHLARTKPQEFLPQEKPKPVWQVQIS